MILGTAGEVNVWLPFAQLSKHPLPAGDSAHAQRSRTRSAEPTGESWECLYSVSMN